VLRQDLDVGQNSGERKEIFRRPGRICSGTAPIRRRSSVRTVMRLVPRTHRVAEKSRAPSRLAAVNRKPSARSFHLVGAVALHVRNAVPTMRRKNLRRAIRQHGSIYWQPTSRRRRGTRRFRRGTCGTPKLNAEAWPPFFFGYVFTRGANFLTSSAVRSVEPSSTTRISNSEGEKFCSSTLAMACSIIFRDCKCQSVR